jgi:hypothetical protein
MDTKGKKTFPASGNEDEVVTINPSVDRSPQITFHKNGDGAAACPSNVGAPPKSRRALRSIANGYYSQFTCTKARPGLTRRALGPRTVKGPRPWSTAAAVGATCSTAAPQCHDALGETGTTFRELECRTPVLSWRAVPLSPTIS